MKNISSLCIFGDSTAWGAWDLEKGGWVNRLWLDVAERTDGQCEIYNLSISGATTETILTRFEAEAKIREADALIFQSGGMVCAENTVPFVDTLNLLDNADLDDGLHPNAAGHQKIFEKVRDFLIKEGWI